MRRYSSEEEDRPLVGMQEMHERISINRHSLKINNQIDGQDYLIDCMSEKFRRFIPNYSDKVPLGSVVAGIVGDDIEKARNCHKNFIHYKINELSKSLGWFKRSVVDSFAEQKDEKWRRKWLQDDFNKFLSNIGIIKMVAHVDIGKNLSELVDNVKVLDKMNIENTVNLKHTPEFKDVQLSFDKSILFFANINQEQKVTKKRKLKR